MDLRGRLRKAAELFVELPPEEQRPAGETAETPSSAGASGMSDIDARLAAMNQTIQGLGSGQVPATPPPGDASGHGPTKTVEQIVREAEGPNLDEIKAPAGGATPAVVGADGTVDFASLYGQSGIPAAPFSAEQMLELIASLPAELPLDTKRQTMKVTLGAMGKSIGATPETIVADASRKLAALAGYAENISSQTAEVVAATQREIAALQEQIEQKHGAILEATRRQEQVVQKCTAESDRLDDVLEFFSLDLPPSKYAAPAQDPGQPPPLPPQA